MKATDLIKIFETLKKSHAEFEMLSLFDKNKNWIGHVFVNGFGINPDYKYADQIAEALKKNGIAVWNQKTQYEIEMEDL
ncbi:MAG TPA: hypothetical protein VLA13_08800 [Massilibacterium sp.]|nr:hypothetical protein [Massilibacterium sp.]